MSALSQPPNPKRSAPDFWVVHDMFLFPYIPLRGVFVSLQFINLHNYHLKDLSDELLDSLRIRYITDDPVKQIAWRRVTGTGTVISM